MKYEYGEPWTQSLRYACEITKADGTFITWPGDVSNDHRIIACINVCAGVSNEQLEKIGLGGVAKIMTERKLDERNLRSESQGKEPNGPPLTAEQAAAWEWTGETPRRLGGGESGIRSHCVNANCCEPGGILKSFCGEETHSYYWPLRRRLHTQSTETSAPQPATLNDIADLLACILDRMPEQEVE